MKRCALLAASLCAVLVASADEIRFKSGDRLTGTVLKVAGGKMTFSSAVAGKVTVNMADIETFSTDAPIRIVLADGKVVERQAAIVETGNQVALRQDAAETQVVALADIGKVNPDKVKWTGIIAAGMNLTRGNTKSDTINLSADAVRRSEDDRNTVALGYTFSKQRDNDTRQTSTSADKWFVRGQYDHFFSPKLYGYGNLRVEKDRVADLKMRVTPGMGLGYQWRETSDLKFFTECGLSYVYEKYDDPSVTHKYTAARFAYRLDKTLSETVRLYHTLEYIPSMEDFGTYLLNTDVGLRAAITPRLSLDAKAQLAYNSDPAVGRDKKDWQYILGVGWMF